MRASLTGDHEADAAVAWLDSEMRRRDREDRGWSPPSDRRRGGGSFFSIKEDGFPTCGNPDACSNHAGEASYADGPRYDAYGHGYYTAEYGAKVPRYGIPLIEDHWKRPCP